MSCCGSSKDTGSTIAQICACGCATAGCKCVSGNCNLPKTGSGQCGGDCDDCPCPTLSTCITILICDNIESRECASPDCLCVTREQLKNATCICICDSPDDCGCDCGGEGCICKRVPGFTLKGVTASGKGSCCGAGKKDNAQDSSSTSNNEETTKTDKCLRLCICDDRSSCSQTPTCRCITRAELEKATCICICQDKSTCGCECDGPDCVCVEVPGWTVKSRNMGARRAQASGCGGRTVMGMCGMSTAGRWQCPAMNCPMLCKCPAFSQRATAPPFGCPAMKCPVFNAHAHGQQWLSGYSAMMFPMFGGMSHPGFPHHGMGGFGGHSIGPFGGHGFGFGMSPWAMTAHHMPPPGHMTDLMARLNLDTGKGGGCRATNRGGCGC